MEAVSLRLSFFGVALLHVRTLIFPRNLTDLLLTLSFITIFRLALDLLLHLVNYQFLDFFCRPVNDLIEVLMTHFFLGRIVKSKILSSEPVTELVAG